MKPILAAVLLLIPFPAVSQAQESKWWIAFTDKSGSPYSVSDPGGFLSPRAIARRQAQSIPVNQTDLPVNPQYIDSISDLGIEVLNRSRWFNAVTVRTMDYKLLQRIAAFPFVASMEPVTVYDLRAEPGSVTGAFKSGSTDYGAALEQMEMVNGDFLHRLGYDGEGKLIAVLDAGFSRADEMAALGAATLAGGFDFVDRDESWFEGATHGTYVLSIMASQLPGLITGTAPGASYLLIRTEDTRSEMRVEEDNWIAGAEFADSAGADIINSSLGYSLFGDTAMNYSYSDMDGNTARVTIMLP